MPVEQVPGIWDFLGQGLSTFASVKTAKDDKEKEQERQAIEQLQRMVQSGAMDSATANAQPIAIKTGMKFQPSQQEMARKIVANPTGQPGTSMPDLSKYFATPGSLPTGAGTAAMPAPAMGTTVKPWSNDQRLLAGLPSSGAMAADALTEKLTGIKNRYVSGGPISPVEASAANVKTPAQIQLDRQKELEPVLTSAATRHVDELVYNGKIDTSDPKMLSRNATVIANQAYQNWLKEAEVSGSLSSLTPEDRAHAKSFFASAVAEKVQDAQKFQQRMREINAGRVGQNDKSVAVYSALTNVAADFDRQAEKIATSGIGSAIVNASPEVLAKNPGWAATRRQYDQAQQSAQTYRQNALGVLIGKIDPSKFNLGAATPPASTGGQTPGSNQSGIPDRSPEAFIAAKQAMLRVPAESRAAELESRKHLLSPGDYLKLKQELGIK